MPCACRIQVRALSLIKKHGSIEGVLAALDSKKYQIPEPFPYQEARRLFKGGCREGWVGCRVFMPNEP